MKMQKAAGAVGKDFTKMADGLPSYEVQQILCRLKVRPAESADFIKSRFLQFCVFCPSLRQYGNVVIRVFP